MTATEEPTLYDVLEVDPASSIDELREAVDRARETFGTESLAVYALVDEEQLGELRARLDEAAEVLLDPARRASYDRSIGRIVPATLWAEDEDEDEAPLPPVEPGLHAHLATLDTDDEADEPEASEPEESDDGGEAEAPRQHALALEVPGLRARSDACGGGGRAAAGAGRDARQGLLSGDWAAAVPKEHAARPASALPLHRRAGARGRRAGEAAGAGRGAGRGGRDAGALWAAAVARPAGQASCPAARGRGGGPGARPGAPGRSAAEQRRPRASPGPCDAAPREQASAGHRGRRRVQRRAVAAGARVLRAVAAAGCRADAHHPHHLENVEADRYDKLPATVYLRGIL